MSDRSNQAGLDAEVGKAPANTGGTHGGINPAGTGSVSDAPAHGSSGNPGTEFPWEGPDATPKPGELPPLKSL